MPALLLGAGLMLSAESVCAFGQPATNPGENVSDPVERKSKAKRRSGERFAAPGQASMPTKAPPRAVAPQSAASPARSIFVFGGQYTTGGFASSAIPFRAPDDNNYIAVIAYAADIHRFSTGLIFGAEVGLGYRFGTADSYEAWGGANFRLRPVVLFDSVKIGAGITVGFSMVTEPMGIEVMRETRRHGDARFLGYLGPELTLASLKNANVELVYRLHHRSGANGAFGGMGEGANANVIGLRYHF
jgi:hypothetical protein